MSLNYNLSNVKYYQEDFSKLYVKYTQFGSEYEDLNQEAKGMVFATVTVGIGTITNSNASEFYARYKFLEKIDETCLYSYLGESGDWEDQFITADIVNKYIGLSTNVCFESNTLWLDRIYKRDKKLLSRISKSDAKVYIKYHSMEYKERFKVNV